MLEKLVAWILNSYLGDYLELNTDQLSVGILSGQVELENIPLKKNAFDKFDLPLQVKSGLVGKISLSVPVAGLSSQSWVINVSDVYIVIGPKPRVRRDEEAERKMAEANKKRMLEDLEGNWKLEREPENSSSSSYGSWLSYGAGIATNIMENLQLNLSNLHIRYESGETTTPATPFSFGFVIEKLAAQSTDHNWKPQYVSSNTGGPIVHKLVELIGMSLYWDNKTADQSTSLSPQTHNYLLEPVSGKALVKRNTSAQPLRSQNEPRMNMELQFDSFLLSLNDLQYSGISTLLREFDLHERRKPYRVTRPTVDVHTDCRQWWQHAIQSNLSKIRDKNERSSKDYILKRCRDCVDYVNIYYNHLVGERLPHHDSRVMRTIETDTDFDTLKVLRQLAVARVKSDGRWYQEVPTSQPSTGYMSSWVTWYTGKSSDSSSGVSSADGNSAEVTPSASNTSMASQRGSIDSSHNPGLKLTSTERAKLEEELRDWVGSSEPAESRSTLNKDNVFLHLTFVLHQVKFKLKQHNQEKGLEGIVQLECHTIQSTATIKPRTRSTKFSLSLGELYVRDLYNQNTQFPLLISPRQTEVPGKAIGVGLATFNLTKPAAFSLPRQLDSKVNSDLFYFEIEKNPSHSSKDIKIQIKTEPLDIIYNEGVVKQVQQFFSPRRRSQAMSRELSEFHLAERARRRYEQLKNKTKIDIRDTWENLLNTSTVKSSKRVGLMFDISAPQLIVPRDLCDSKTYMVVFDLGRLKVSNLQDNVESNSLADVKTLMEPKANDAQDGDTNIDIADDDDFVTPMSTPPPELESEASSLPSNSRSDLEVCGDNLYTHMYDRYEVLLADIQVLIVSRKDNWRLLTTKGYSHFHIVDKLSVNILFERRLLLTADPQWPAIKLSAIMESLSVHISELKLNQLTHCLQKISNGGGATPSSSDTNQSTTSPERSESQGGTTQPHMVHSQSRLFAPPETRTVLDNSRVVTCGLDIHQMSLDINNKERCLVELQVAGVKADFTQLPSQTDLSLTVHSLIVVDALQSYGPDFELLVTSHRNLGLDSKSGSMCSSTIASPISPKSPQSPHSPPRSPEPEYHQAARRQTSYTSFQNAVLSGIQKLLPVATATPMADHSAPSLKPPSVSSSDHRPVSPVFLGEPLIKVDYVQSNRESCEESASRTVDIVFNNLDLVANQETIVEILAFFNEVVPKPASNADITQAATASDNNESETTSPDDTVSDAIVVQAEFRKLNILLHCPHIEGTSTLRNVAGVTFPHVLVNKVAMISMMGARMEAAVGGSTPSTIEAELGGLQVTDLSPNSVHAHVFAFGNMSSDGEGSHLDRTIPAHMYQTCVGELTAVVEKKAFHMSYSKADDIIKSDSVTLGIGSIQYIHVPRFLHDLGHSVSLFTEYIERAKQKIKDAASEVAESFVYQKKAELQPTLLFDVAVDVTLDAPLLVLPRNASSTEVLVAELGKMTISNQRLTELSPPSTSDIINIQIRDVKMVTKEVDPQKTKRFEQEVILEEAGVNFAVVYKQINEAIHSSGDGEDFYMELGGLEERPERSYTRRLLNLRADVPHALEVSLSRQAYELMQEAMVTAGTVTSDPRPSFTSHTPSKGDAKSKPTMSSQKSIDDKMICVTAALAVPTVSVCIKDQLGGSEAVGIIELSLVDLSVGYEQITPHISNVRLQISSLSALDLLQPEDSKHRYVLLSLDKSSTRGDVPRFISTSLPGTLVRSRKRKLDCDMAASSLPTSITDDNIRLGGTAMVDSVPATPPSSPSPDTETMSSSQIKNLVTITLTLVDKNIPEFSTLYNSINTTVDIDFNSLEIIVNQETWVMVLDFFGLGAKVFTPQQQHEANVILKTEHPTEGLRANLSMNSLSVVLVKKCYDLARANVTGLQAEVIKQQRTTKIKGALGSLCLDDLSPHGCLHSSKFTTWNESARIKGNANQTSALTFDVLKHDVPDERLDREFDVTVDLEMSSVIYTHTKRFPIEIINFLQDFLEQHDNIGHMRAASSGQQVPSGPGHSPRVVLNITAGTPIIILPGSSLSNEVIVMHLGNLSVSNKFLFAGEAGTLAAAQKDAGNESSAMNVSMDYSYDPMTSSVYCRPDETLESIMELNESRSNQSCLLDIMSVRLTEMDLISAKRVTDEGADTCAPTDNTDIKLKGYSIRMDKNQPLKERCVLDLVIERNLDNDLSHNSPEIAIRGTLSSVYCHLDVQQYMLVRAVLDQNLGEELNDLQRVAKQLPHIQTILSGNVWTVLDMSIDLHNVTIELLQRHQALSSPAVSLAKLDFVTSNLAFVSYSNQSKDIDLVSQEIRVTDTRSASESVFKDILQPMCELADKSSTLHMEIHMRSSKAKNCASILFNNMKIFCVVDWLVALKDYLISNPEKQLIKETPRVSENVASSLASPAVDDTQENPDLELKLNLTDTELVLVEDLTSTSSNAIILKTTAVSHFQPTKESRPLICNLQKMELFSCCLCAETNTALSIIDPFDVTVELARVDDVPPENEDSSPTYKLEINLSDLFVRFSYNDLLLFKRIMKSLPQQLNSAVAQDEQSDEQRQQQHQSTSADSSTVSPLSLAVTSIEATSSQLSICLINDCEDMDVPLLELHLKDFAFDQKIAKTSITAGDNAGHVTFEEPISGSFTFRISLDYYNRLLSGWEPFVEPWKLEVAWQGNPAVDQDLNVQVTSPDIVNFNITSAILEMIRQTRDLWSSLIDRDGTIMQPITSRESFVPYSLHNQTGRTLLFAIVTKQDGTVSLPTSWTEVFHDQVKPFSCVSSQSKQRHQDSHESINYRLVVMVEGWCKTSPVSIDKVGQFFRTVETDKHGNQHSPKVVASRVVFEVVCMENASKCITVKSPITLENKTSQDIETRLESTIEPAASHVMVLPPNSSKPVPLAFLFSQLWFRPAGNEMLTYTDAAISCQRGSMKRGDVKSSPLLCNSVLDQSLSYRLSALVRREFYPDEAVMETLGDDTLYQPGHTVTLLPPLTIVNLLPVDLGFLVNGSPHTGKLKPGKELTLHQVDSSENLKIDFAAEGYPKAAALYLNSGTSDHLINIRVYDESNRLLLLEAKVMRLALGSVKVIISVRYWMINHTGLPLVFKQVGAKMPAAGQFEENEIARSVAPLMFSFSESEHPELCAMRLGNTLHNASAPAWCHRFPIEKGNHVRRLRVAPRDGRPEWVYNIGIETNRGSGRYQDTNMVILVPYNKIINKSSHRIAFTQKHLTQPGKDDIYQASLPGSSQAYHWPRSDLDQLLCIKILDVANTLWSGGFRIDQLNSIVINIRNSENSDCALMKIETVLQGSTYTTIIADASDIPPPMKIENYTDLSLKYWQTNINHETFKTVVKPKSSVAYAWDEPTLPPTITCAIHCDMGSSENTYDMNVIGQADHLEYENYFYISLTDSADSLVFDVIGGNGIIFSQREPGRRSQLWSHNVEGRLVHVGTTASKQHHRDLSLKYCLDIAELAVIAEGCSCLALRKIDSRRQTTQLWKFQEDGKLMCGIQGQCVQSLPAFGGMRAGARVALGPFDIGQPPGAESRLSMSKMLPGSGVLSVTINTEGPTRILRISDIHDLENLKDIGLSSLSDSRPVDRVRAVTTRHVTLSVSLPALGLSLVNHVPEELVYLSLSHAHMKLERIEDIQVIHVHVRHIQLDNQLPSSTCPIIIYSQKQRHQSSKHRSQAIEIECQHVLASNSSMHVFKLLSVQIAPFSLDVDEVLLFKVIEMFNWHRNESEGQLEVGRMQLPKDEDFDVNVRKYYFALLKVSCGQMTLSVHTAKLPPHLQQVKRSMAAMSPMITFENAIIDFDSFQQLHPFESLSFLLAAVGTHFKRELQGQAAKIFGAVNVLGNPLGLVNDVTTGLSGLVTEGNVGMLLKNVTHGASNSLAKVTGTLSQGLGWITMDDSHEESRDLIRKQYTGSNVLLGLKSLSHGLVGGLTSIAQQTYDGASQRGIEGMLTGFGKGVVGTVTKPVVGVLDFASGAATAIRDTSGGGGGIQQIQRKRRTRCCYSRSGLLPSFSLRSSVGQEVIMFINGEKRAQERYVDHVPLFNYQDSVSLLASDQTVYVLKMYKPQEEPLLNAPLSNLLSCTYIRKERSDGGLRHYLEVKVRELSETGGSHYKLRNPQFCCMSAEVAEQAVLLVDHARSIYDERLHTVSTSNLGNTQ